MATAVVVEVLVLLVYLLLADYAWIRAMRPRYEALVWAVQARPMAVNVQAAALAYIGMVVSILVFAMPLARARLSASAGNATWLQKLKAATVYGGCLGLVVYGIFNATNSAIFAGYDASMALADTLWGAVLYGSATLLLLLFVR